MQSSGRIAREVLAVLDPVSGGVYSAGVDSIRLILEKRGHLVDAPALRTVLGRLVREGKVERVETEDRGPVYTRPEVLLQAKGVASAVRRPKGP